jgi:hypothetical protein
MKSEISDSGREVIQAILDLGAELIELEYRITPPMLQEILPLLKKRQVSVLSLHNFFPLPEGLPKREASGDIFSLSSPEKEERELAVKYTRRTIEWAQELEAKAVVLHLGKTLFHSPMETLKKLYDEKKIQSAEGKAFITEQKKLRAAQSRPYLDSALWCLEKLAKEAEKGLFPGAGEPIQYSGFSKMSASKASNLFIIKSSFLLTSLRPSEVPSLLIS